MIKRLLLLLTGIVIAINITFAQNFILSNTITSNSQVTIVDMQKASDGTIVTGYFIGTLDVPAAYTAVAFDAFVAKYDEDFLLEWIQPITGSFAEFPFGLTLHDNYIYLVGAYKGTCDFDGGSEILDAGTSTFDAFLAKYNLDGNFVWAKPIAYNEADQQVRAIDIDKDDDLIIAGYYTDSINIIGNTFVEANGLFITKADTSGSVIWANSIATDDVNSRIEAVSAFNSGYYFSGNIKGSIDFDVKNISSSNASYTDAFLYKTDFTGNGLWLRKTYGSGDDDTRTGTITGDNFGNVYFTGFFGTSYIQVDENNTTVSSKQLTNNGSLDAFIIKYNKTGDLSWSYNYGNEGEEWARDIEYKNGFLYLTGYFSDTLYVEDDTLTSSDPDDNDALLAMFDAKGNLLRAAHILDSDNGTVSGVALDIDDENNAYWGGDYKATEIYIGDSTHTLAGTKSGFISKYKPTFTVAFTKKQGITCNGSDDGELIVTPFFGVPPFDYNWSHDVDLNDSTATGLAPGIYSVKVTDFTGSKDSVQYTIVEPDSFIFNPDITNVTTCSYSTEGAITLNTTGGNGGNQYNWFEDEGGSGVQLTSKDQSGLTTGKYCVTVTDMNGCAGDTAIYITGPEPIYFGNSVVTDYSSPVAKGDIDLSITGGFGDPASFTYDWTGPSGFTSSDEDITDLDPGNYTIEVTDVHLCNFDTIFNVKDLDTFYVYISDKKDACNGVSNGNATASFYSPKGHTNISYLWDANAGSQETAKATGLAPGRYYYVTVTDLEETPNCVMEDSVYIDELTYTFAGAISGSSKTELDCYGDSDGFIDLNITSAGVQPYTYNWSNGAETQDIVDLAVNDYSVTVTDVNECSFTILNTSVTQPDQLAATAEITNEPQCNGGQDGSVNVLRNGGTIPYTYKWNDPGSQTSQTADALYAGYYTVTVTDYNGCEVTASVNLTEPETISILNESSTDESATGEADGTITVIATGGTDPLEYTLTPGDVINNTGIFTGLSGGDYTVSVTDLYDCEPAVSNTITVGVGDAINDLNIKDQIKIYPNPTNSKITVSIDLINIKNLKVDILNIAGEVIENRYIFDSDNIIEEFDLSAYSKGIYFIRISSEKINYTDKIVLQ